MESESGSYCVIGCDGVSSSYACTLYNHKQSHQESDKHTQESANLFLSFSLSSSSEAGESWLLAAIALACDAENPHSQNPRANTPAQERDG